MFSSTASHMYLNSEAFWYFLISNTLFLYPSLCSLCFFRVCAAFKQIRTFQLATSHFINKKIQNKSLKFILIIRRHCKFGIYFDEQLSLLSRKLFSTRHIFLKASTCTSDNDRKKSKANSNINHRKLIYQTIPVCCCCCCLFFFYLQRRKQNLQQQITIYICYLLVHSHFF